MMNVTQTFKMYFECSIENTTCLNLASEGSYCILFLRSLTLYFET